MSEVETPLFWSEISGKPQPLLVRVIAVLVMTLFYYLMWMLVRLACRSFISPVSETKA